ENFAPDSQNGPGGNRKVLLILAGVVGVLVLGAAAYFLFLSGGSSDEGLGAVPSAQPAPSASAPTGKKGGDDDNTLPQHVNRNFQRGPTRSKPLPAEKPTVTTDSTGTTDTGTGTTTDTGTGTTTDTGTGTTTNTGNNGGSGSGNGGGSGTTNATSYTVGVN